MLTQHEIAANWLPRYTGMPFENFGKHILLTNFDNYFKQFCARFGITEYDQDRPMQAATNSDGLTMINYGIGSPNAATIMDLLIPVAPKAVLFLGKCGGLKKSTEIGHFILPVAAIRGEGTSNDYFPPEVPALPSFKIHKLVSQVLVQNKLSYKTGVIYTTNRRVWEHDLDFLHRLQSFSTMGIDMETATLFIVGHKNHIPRGALLLVSDVPTSPDGIKTEESDAEVTENWADLHLNIGIETMTSIAESGEPVEHFLY
jgi:AMP nucleosidase